MNKTQVAVIIPTFNGRKLLEKHLPNVLSALRNGDELLIIDDASQDETSTWLRFGFSLREQLKPNDADGHGPYELYQGIYGSPSKKIAITLIVNDHNLRFAASVNRAVRHTTKQLVLLLNSDVSPKKSAVTELVRSYSEQAQPIFGIGCLEYEGSDESAEKAGKNVLWFQSGYFMHQKASDFTSGETAWISGGSGLFDRERWLELGGFDERFAPAYWEDIDLSYRAKQKGWQVLFESKAVVFHKHESTHKQVFSSKDMENISWQHAAYFVRKHGNIWQKIAHALWQPYWFIKRLKS